MVDEPAVLIAFVVVVWTMPVSAEAVSGFVIYAVGGPGGVPADAPDGF